MHYFFCCTISSYLSLFSSRTYEDFSVRGEISGIVQDIAALYEILKGAKNPADLLMVSIRWMEQGAQAMDFP